MAAPGHTLSGCSAAQLESHRSPAGCHHRSSVSFYAAAQSLVDGVAIKGRARQARKYLLGFEESVQLPRRANPGPSLPSAEPPATAA